MPLQNRVTPAGNIEFSKARGQWLGNRGILHNDQQQIVAPWRHKGWVICRLEFGELQRKLFSAGDYSELFSRRSHRLCRWASPLQLLPPRQR